MRQEMRRSPRNSSTQDDAIGSKRQTRLPQHVAKFRSKTLEGLLRLPLVHRGRSNVTYLGVLARELLKDSLDRHRGNNVLDCAVAIGLIPDLAARGNAPAFHDYIAVNRECRSHTGPQGNSNGALGVDRASVLHLADQGCRCIIQKVNVAWRTAEPLRKFAAQIQLVQRLKFVPHVTDAAFIVERTWHGDGDSLGRGWCRKSDVHQ